MPVLRPRGARNEQAAPKLVASGDRRRLCQERGGVGDTPEKRRPALEGTGVRYARWGIPPTILLPASSQVEAGRCGATAGGGKPVKALPNGHFPVRPPLRDMKIVLTATCDRSAPGRSARSKLRGRPSQTQSTRSNRTNTKTASPHAYMAHHEANALQLPVNR